MSGTGERGKDGNDVTPEDRARIRYALVAATALVGAVLVLLELVDVWLLSFGGVLFAVAVRGAAETLRERAPLPFRLPVRASVGIVCVFLLLLGAGFVLLIGPSFVTGVDELRSSLPDALSRMRELLDRHPEIESFLGRAAQRASDGSVGSDLLGRVDEVFSTAMGLFSGAVGALIGGFVILVVGIYGALSPGTYVGALEAILPAPRARRAEEVCANLAVALRWWLVGRICSMAVVGVLTAIGLSLLGVPAAITLGVIAAVFSFVPNIGPIASAIPAILTAFSIDPDVALYTAALYVGVQTVESYVVTPLIQQRVVTLPPASIIVVQLAFGAAFGFLGLLFSTPLAVVAMVMVKMLWMEDRLGKDVAPP